MSASFETGAHLLAFGGSRTYHRLACAIEDAGFEIRDQIQWIYGSGFPKSLDVSKAIDAMAGAERQVIGVSSGPNNAKYQGERYSEKRVTAFGVVQDQPHLTAPTTDAAKQWNGWGTALKPAHEPIVLARKPLIGTVGENVVAHGTGGLNIDGCRIGNGEDKIDGGCAGNGRIFGGGISQRAQIDFTVGRWPANIIHDGSEEVLAAFPDAPGQQGDLTGHSKDRLSKGIFGDMKSARNALARDDSGSAARFFYCAKASKEDREEGLEDLAIRSAGDVTDRKDGSDGLNSPRAGAGRTNGSRNHHPTVKPSDLMRYLVRLITPPGGTVLDPFAGSGSTGKACVLEGMNVILIEKEIVYCELAMRRARLRQQQFAFTE